MKTTCQSEVGALKSIFLKHVKDAFIDDNTIDNTQNTYPFLVKTPINLR